jgi:hypothetical protein
MHSFPNRLDDTNPLPTKELHSCIVFCTAAPIRIKVIGVGTLDDLQLLDILQSQGPYSQHFIFFVTFELAQ